MNALVLLLPLFSVAQYELPGSYIARVTEASDANEAAIRAHDAARRAAHKTRVAEARAARDKIGKPIKTPDVPPKRKAAPDYTKAKQPEPWIGGQRAKRTNGWTPGEPFTGNNWVWRVPFSNAAYRTAPGLVQGERGTLTERLEAHYSDNGNFAEACQILEVDFADVEAAQKFCVEHWLKNPE